MSKGEPKDDMMRILIPTSLLVLFAAVICLAESPVEPLLGDLRSEFRPSADRLWPLWDGWQTEPRCPVWSPRWTTLKRPFAARPPSRWAI